MWVGTYGQGIFRSEGLPLGLNKEESLLPVVSVFPNPTNGAFKILAQKGDNIESISIASIDGKLIYKNDAVDANFYSVETNVLDKGILLVSVWVEGAETIHKVILN